LNLFLFYITWYFTLVIFIISEYHYFDVFFERFLIYFLFFFYIFNYLCFFNIIFLNFIE